MIDYTIEDFIEGLHDNPTAIIGLWGIAFALVQIAIIHVLVLL